GRKEGRKDLATMFCFAFRARCRTMMGRPTIAAVGRKDNNHGASHQPFSFERCESLWAPARQLPWKIKLALGRIRFIHSRFYVRLQIRWKYSCHE
ncbi:MAG TPA: hypothetical protein DEP84_30385, partial [Chloroflexi bacterium]|nr:hypothetical protein [Chloroflexota bacterium]